MKTTKRWPWWASRIARIFGLVPKADVLATFKEPELLRHHILRYGPDGYKIYTPEQITNMLAAEKLRADESEKEQDRLRNLCITMRRSFRRRIGRDQSIILHWSP